MEKSLNPTPQKIVKQAPKATATVSKPQNDQQEVDFLDFVPIDNNVDDFDLQQILGDIEKNQTEQQQVKDIQPNLALAPTTPRTATLNYDNPSIPVANANTVNNVTNNSTQMQNQPIIPKMIFPNSNVTINYNLSR